MTNWNAIVTRDGSLVWRTLWRLLGDRTDVEECFQETFVAALKLSRRQPIDSWPAVLSRLATARAMDRLRSRYRIRNLQRPQREQESLLAQGSADALAAAVSTEAGPTEQAIAAELSQRLRMALAQLPDKQAELFYLFALDGWTQLDLAERFAMTENAVAVAIHRARQELKELLHDEN